MYQEKNDYKAAFNRFNECYQIRKNNQDSKHPDVIRALSMLKLLESKVQAEMQKAHQSVQNKTTFEQLTEKLSMTIYDKIPSKVLSSKMHPNFESLGMSKVHGTGGMNSFIKDSRDVSILQDNTQVATPPPEHNGFTDLMATQKPEEHRTMTFASAHSTADNRGKSNEEKEPTAIGILSKLLVD